VLFNAAWGERLVAKKITRWSMKLDRELIALSKTRTLEAIAAKVQRPPESVLKRAVRLGLTIER
jgi:hypothetical protein